MILQRGSGFRLKTRCVYSRGGYRYNVEVVIDSLLNEVGMADGVNYMGGEPSINAIQVEDVGCNKGGDGAPHYPRIC